MKCILFYLILLLIFTCFCSKPVLQTLYRMVEAKSSALIGSQTHKGLSYANFIELLDHVAQNCAFGSKKYKTSEGRVRAMFHHMNSSRGRAKLNRDSNALIINPLTGLESTDPIFESSSSHRKNVVSKVSTLMTSTPDKDMDDKTWQSSPSKKLPISHYQQLRTIKTPPRESAPETNNFNERPEWNFR